MKELRCSIEIAYMNLGLFFIISSLEKRKNVRDQVRIESLSREDVGSMLLILSSGGFSRVPLGSQLVLTGQLLPGHVVSSFRPVMTESEHTSRVQRHTRAEKHSVLGYSQPLLSSRILVFLAKKLHQISFCFLCKNENFTPNSKYMDLFG